MNFIAEIDIMPQRALLDPQGKAVASGLNNMGFKITNARVGKHITLELLAENEEEAKKKVEEACKKLLANQITESFEYKIIAS